MIRYLLILLTGGAIFLGLSHAWPQDKPARQAPGKNVQAGQDQQKQAVNPFSRRNKQNGGTETRQPDEKVILSQMPGLKLKGIVKFKGKDPIGLLEVDSIDGTVIHTVSNGYEFSVTLPGEDVIQPKDLIPPPLPPAQEKDKAKSDDKDVNGQQAGVRVQPTKIKLKEIQVHLKVVAISRKGVEVEALPLKERILVR